MGLLMAGLLSFLASFGLSAEYFSSRYKSIGRTNANSQKEKKALDMNDTEVHCEL